MSTQTIGYGNYEFAPEQTTEKSGFWAKFFEGFVTAREKEARLRVSQHLAGMPDAQLKNIGFEDAEIRVLRETGVLPGFKQ
ncbi:MAG: hypothetical protein AAF346_17280 [Pseudomonadota bacterium]